MKALTVIKGFTQEWVALLITLRGFFWAPEQQIQRKPCLASVTDLADFFEMSPLKGHHNEDVGIGVPAALAAGKGAKQNHVFWGELLHQPLGEGLQRLTGDQGLVGVRGSHSPILR